MCRRSVHRMRCVCQHENDARIRVEPQLLVNPSGLTREVGIIGAQHQAGMIRSFFMEAAEVLAVECHDDPAIAPRILRYAANRRKSGNAPDLNTPASPCTR